MNAPRDSRAPAAGQGLVLAVATGFGLGLSPVASGTAGTLPGLVLALALSSLPVPVQAVAALLLAAAAIPICTSAERIFGKKDDHRIVADEYLTFPLCVIGLPLSPWVLAMAFVTNRVLDVLKPPPARQIQRLPEGWGVVLDDAIACLYGLALNHLLYRLALRWLGV